MPSRIHSAIFQVFSLFFCLGFFLYSATITAQKTKQYARFVDSAGVYVHANPQLAWTFLDSIPTPATKYIEGHLAYYYKLKGMLYFKSGDQTKLFNNFSLAVKYGEKEKNYDIAGEASLDMFSNTYALKKDSSVYKYLDNAKKYFTLANNENGLIEVMQMPAFIAFQNHEYEKSNTLLLENLDIYKNVEDDGYYYLFAIYMLADNFTHLNDLKKANKYRKTYQSLQNNPTIDAFNFHSYDVSLNVCMASRHFKNKQIDSTLLYLSYANKSEAFMDYNSKKLFYELNSELYDMMGDGEKSRMYSDSLKRFEKKLLDKNIAASYEITENFIQSEEALKSESTLKLINRYWLIASLILLVFLIGAFILYYKKLNKKLTHFINQRRNYSQLSSNYEKLKVKTLNLEEYIIDLRKEIKKIASNDDVEKQRQSIRELYKNIHLESPTLINNGENHLQLINELNLDFFNKLKTEYPKLNDSEIIICYYLAMDFKNKEIALFINRTTRAIESKRYRLSKKMGLDKGDNSLTSLLKDILTISENKVVSK